MTQDKRIQPELVVGEATWLQAFTKKMVRDAVIAEDISQEALLAGLSSDGSAGRSRSWFARVARNIAINLTKRESKRRQVEQSVPPTPNARETAELVAEAELQKKAVQALLDLREPFRSAILWRYMKGLSNREIASKTGEPVETVRTRVKRGLAMLRSRLDRDHGGRHAWLAPLGLGVLPRNSTVALWGVVLMNMKVKLAVAGGLVGALLLGTLYWSGDAAAPERVPERPVGAMTASSFLEEDPVAGAAVRNPLEIETGTADATAHLTVSVVWRDNGLPAADVGVEFFRSGDWKAAGTVAVTDRAGTAHFDNVQPGEISVRVDRMGNIWYADLSAGQRDTVKIELPRALDVRGIVVDQNGVGVGGAQVLVANPGTQPQWLYPNMKTEADGTFFLRSLGGRMVAARADDYGTSDLVFPRSSEAVDGEVAIRLVLPKSPAELRGMVQDPQGRPVPDAFVAIGRADGVGPPQVRLETDAEGRFEASLLKPDRHPVFVYARGLAPWSSVVECAPRSTTELNVQLPSAAGLYGTVTDGEGKPVKGVSLSVPGISWPHRSWVETNEQGQYRLADMPAGEVTVTVVSDELDRRTRTWQLVAGQDQQWDLVINDGPQIRGILLGPDGQPLEGCWLRHDSGSRHVSAGAEGQFVLGGCEIGRLYSVRVQAGPGFLPTLHSFESVSPGPETQTFRIPASSMPSATIVGRILTPDGAGLEGATLSMVQNGRSVHMLPRTDALGNPSEFVDSLGFFEMGPIDELGNFEIGPLPPGDYEVRVYHPDYARTNLGTITLSPGEVRRLPDRRFSPGAQLEVVLHHSRAEQLYGLRVQLQTLQGRRVRDATIADGEITFPVLEPGSFRLSVTGANIAEQLLPVDLEADGSTRIELTLR